MNDKSGINDGSANLQMCTMVPWTRYPRRERFLRIRLGLATNWRSIHRRQPWCRDSFVHCAFTLCTGVGSHQKQCPNPKVKVRRQHVNLFATCGQISVTAGISTSIPHVDVLYRRVLH